MAEVVWKNIDTIPENWLDGRKVLVFDVGSMTPLLLEYHDGAWQYGKNYPMRHASLITHYAFDVSYAPSDLSADYQESFMAIGSAGVRRWVVALTYAKSQVPEDGLFGVKQRAAILYIAMCKLKNHLDEVKVYRNGVAEAFEKVFGAPHTYQKVGYDLLQLTKRGLIATVNDGDNTWPYRSVNIYEICDPREQDDNG